MPYMIKNLLILRFWENSQKLPCGFECAARRRMSANPILGFQDEPPGGKDEPVRRREFGLFLHFLGFCKLVVFSEIVMCMMRIQEKCGIVE